MEGVLGSEVGVEGGVFGVWGGDCSERVLFDLIVGVDCFFVF